MNEVSFSSQHITTTVDHFCLLLGICKKHLGAFFLKKTHTSIISVEHHTDVLQKEKIFRLRFPFLMGAYYLWVKIVGAVVWEHGNICLGKKSHRTFRPKKIKYLVQIFYFVSQFMINAHHHLFVADVVVALIQFLGVLRQN